MRVELEALDHVGLVVADVSRSVRWYQEDAGPAPRPRGGVGGLPGGAGGERQRGGPVPERGRGSRSRSTTRCATSGFRTSRRGLEMAKAELAANGVEYEEGDYGVAWSVPARPGRLPRRDHHLRAGAGLSGRRPAPDGLDRR